MDKEKLNEAAKINQLKYFFDETVNETKISELRQIGVGNFVDGANWMMEQMMKGAVTADVGYYNQRGLSLYPKKSLEELDFNEEDKVKVIIIKEE